MKKKPNYYKEFVDRLSQLHTKYPNDNIGRHLSMAFADYPDLWTVTDKELVFALEKYQMELELDTNNIADDSYVRQIEEDARHLFDDVIDEEE